MISIGRACLKVDLEKSGLTYEQFQNYMFDRRDTWNAEVLDRSRKGWDDQDVAGCDQILRDLYVEKPIEPAPKKK